MRYWDGRQWQQQTRVPANQASVGLLQQTTAKPSKALSILAFTLAGGALLIPFLGLGGIGLGIAAAGAVVGLAGALAATRVLRSLLFDVAPSDPLTFAAIAALLFVTVLVASWTPARRASRVPPAEVLRSS